MFCIFASVFNEKIKYISKKSLFAVKRCRFEREKNSFFHFLLLKPAKKSVKNGILKAKNEKCKEITASKAFNCQNLADFRDFLEDTLSVSEYFALRGRSGCDTIIP